MKPRLWLMLLCVAACAGVVRLRYWQTRNVIPWERAVRSVEDTAAEGRRAALTVVRVGASRALIRRPREGHRWLLYWSGNSTTYFRNAVDVIERLALPPEVGVLIVAPPGLDSEGTPTAALVAREAVSAREWLRAEQGAEQIVVGSFSMGCYSVYAAAREHVVGAVVVGASEDLELSEPGRLFRLRSPTRFDRDPTPPPVPGVVIQGADDPYEPTESDVLLRWWPRLRRVTVPGVGHEGVRLAPQAITAMREAITTLLGTSSSPTP